MILIAESGATKTDWVCISNDGKQNRISSKGLNPNNYSQQDLSAEILSIKKLLNVPELGNLFFYGAGCINEVGSAKMKTALQANFPKWQCEVYGDAETLTRLKPNAEKYFAGILGTGSLGALIINNKLKELNGGLGYILGDEASGAYFGKLFIADLLVGKISDELSGAFNQKYSLSRADILNKLYREEKPNVFLAGFMPFLKEYIHTEYVVELLTKGFREYFLGNKKLIIESDEIVMIGGVAYFFTDLLRTVAVEMYSKSITIFKSPLESLIKYHGL